MGKGDKSKKGSKKNENLAKDFFVTSSWASDDENDFLPAEPAGHRPQTGGWRGSSEPSMSGRMGREPLDLPTEVPNNPPFQAFVGNLDYSVDVDAIKEFFNDIAVLDARLPISQESGQPKGFAYVDFATKDDLIKALAMNEEMFGKRRIKVNLPAKREERGGREKVNRTMDFGRDVFGGSVQESRGPNRVGSTGSLDRGSFGQDKGERPDRPPVAFDRDSMGAQQPRQGGMRGSHSGGDIGEMDRGAFGQGQPQAPSSSGPIDFDRDSMGTNKQSIRQTGTQPGREIGELDRDAFGQGQPAISPTQPKSSGPVNFDRDSMGASQPQRTPAAPPRDLGELDRDTFGQGQPQAPAAPSGPPASFDRDSMGQGQPVQPRQPTSTGGKDLGELGRDAFGQGQPQAPAPPTQATPPAGDRPAPVAFDRDSMGQQPQQPTQSQPPASVGRKGFGNQESQASTFDRNAFGQDQPVAPAPEEAPAPAEKAWKGGAGAPPGTGEEKEGGGDGRWAFGTTAQRQPRKDPPASPTRGQGAGRGGGGRGGGAKDKEAPTPSSPVKSPVKSPGKGGRGGGGWGRGGGEGKEAAPAEKGEGKKKNEKEKKGEGEQKFKSPAKKDWTHKKPPQPDSHGWAEVRKEEKPQEKKENKVKAAPKPAAKGAEPINRFDILKKKR